MNAKELIQLNDQFIAFNAVMTGSLQKEIDDAKAAIDALGGAQAIVAQTATLEQAKADFEAYKATVADVFTQKNEEVDKATAAVAALQVSVEATQASVVEGQAQLESDKKALAVAQEALSASIAAHNADVDQHTVAVEKAEEDLSARSADLDKLITTFSFKLGILAMSLEI